MKLYLAGKMRGILKNNFPLFDFAAARLREKGFNVFSPAENDRKILGLPADAPGDHPLIKTLLARDCFRDDMHYICVHADAVALLPDWETSKGATAEHALARALGHTIIFLGDEFLP
jgi:Domain of unknown function (DUF4406)